MKPDELQRYADTVVRGCVAFRRNETLLIQVNHGHRELVVALAQAAYRAGARTVDVEYDDARLRAAKLLYGLPAAVTTRSPARELRARLVGRKDVAFVAVMGEYELDVTASLPPERVAQEATAGQSPAAMRARREGRLRGSICAWPTEDWAKRVFPGMRPERAQRRLAEDLLSFCRLGPDDPPGHKGWKDHLALLRRRAARLTKLDLKEVLIRDRGTDLRVAIAPNSMWRGGGERDHWGRFVAANMPTEECFISPDARATEGTFRCSRPRAFGGRVLDGLAGEFRGGRLVRLEAKRDDDRDWFARYLAAIPNANRLGEIALVDASSRIGRTGRIYYNALVDENAAAHMAFGSGFAKTRTVPVGAKRWGVNRSRTHIDVMLGTEALEATGIRQNGRPVPLVADGLWQI
jgi:aminopeptidase